MNVENADAICLICGTTKMNTDDGLCVHGHDEWLEDIDSGLRFKEAIDIFGVDLEEIIYAIKNNTDLKPIK